MSPAPVFGLGLDAGGTRTRWALADAHGTLLKQGEVASMGGLQLHSPQGLTDLRQSIEALAQSVGKTAQGHPMALYGGFTGLGDPQDKATLLALLQERLPLNTSTTLLTDDMDVAYRAAFAPGAGYLVYAGTGAISTYIDAQGQAHRAGGRGAVLGDEGGGYWIAREALAHIWREEDHTPGAWRQSPMAQRLFTAIGGSDWNASRAFVYGSDRGAMGKLALHVAASANDDPAAHALMLRAGAALGELAHNMIQRFGHRPVTAGGRAMLLSPLLEQGMRAALPEDIALRTTPDLAAHVTAARLAISIWKTSL